MAAVAGTAHGAVKRELLVRYLDACAPALLHSAKRLTYAEEYHGCPDQPPAVAALRVFAEFADLLPKRRIDVVVAIGDPATQDEVADALAAADAELGLPVQCRVHTSLGPLLPALTEVGALGAPVIALLDATQPGAAVPSDETLAALAADHAAEVLLVLPGVVDGVRGRLHAAGFGLVSAVELVDTTGTAQLLCYATNTERHLDTFKDALWAVDEYAGVRYRDPGDPEHRLLDISLSPNLGPLRRQLLDRVRDSGEQSVADLRAYARSETVYRAADAVKAVQALAAAGAVQREPDHGRITAQTVIRVP